MRNIALAAVACLLLMAGAASAAQTFKEIPVQGSSAVSATFGHSLALAGMPRAARIGADYDFSLNGPLLLEVTGALSFIGDGFGVHIVPGVRYLHVVDSLVYVPYAKAGLALDLLSGEAAAGRDLAVGLKLGGGIRYFFDPEIGVGPELNITTGLASVDGGGSETTFAIDALIAVELRIP